MAVSANATKLANLFDPQVIGARLEKELYPRIRFAPLAVIDYSLAGRPGSTVTLPYYNAIGAAEVVPEGTDIPIKKLTESTVPVSIHKIGIGVELTDESVLSANGSPIQEAVSQMAAAIADKVDTDLLAALEGNNDNKYVLKGVLTDDIADALVLFGDKIEEGGVLIVDAEGYATLRKSKNWIPNTEIGANIIVGGVVGSIYGLQVVVSSKIDKEYHIVRAGALAIYSKRDTLVETDRDIVAKSTVLTADKHFATYLRDSSKAIRILKKAEAAGGATGDTTGDAS